MAADTFVHIADLHFWQVVLNPFRLLNKRFLGNLNVALRRHAEFLMGRAELYADAVAATGVKSAILTGDFASTSTEEEFRLGVQFVRGLERRGLAVHLIPGNHDVYTFQSLRRRRFDYHFHPWMPEEGLPAKRVLPGGTPVVFAPTVCPNMISSKGRITNIEIEGVAERLRFCSSPCIVAGHYPMLHQTYGYHLKPARRLRNAEALRDALGRSGRRILYIAGHVHRFSYVRDDRYPNLSHLTTGAFFRKAPETNSEGDFTEIHVDGDNLRVVLHRFNGRWTTSQETPRPL